MFEFGTFIGSTVEGLNEFIFPICIVNGLPSGIPFTSVPDACLIDT